MMSRIRRQWSGAITKACAGSGIPPAIIAAMIASESGGSATASHPEESILQMFHNILNGLPVKWEPLSRSSLEKLTPGQIAEYGTAWGLTQIVGFHVYPRDPHELLEPDICLLETVVLLGDWANGYGLDPDTQAAELFHCWNGGGPHNRTVPKYVEHTLQHMRTYESLIQAGAISNAPLPAETLQDGRPATLPHTEGATGSGSREAAAPSGPPAEGRRRKAESESGRQEGR